MCRLIVRALKWIRACILLLLLGCNIIIAPIPLCMMALVRLIIPFKSIRFLLFRGMNGVLSLWSDINYWILYPVLRGHWHLPEIQADFNTQHWYAMLANHYSWFDIILINCAFRRKLPPLKFFMKRELLWTLPGGGLACYALGFPFIKTHTRQQIRKNPALKQADISMLQQACQIFKKLPCTPITFVEGTRFTLKKQIKQSSPYRYLLKPRAAALAMVLQQLQPILTSVVDVTLHYSQAPSMWKVLKGEIKHIHVLYSEHTLTTDLCGDYYNDRAYRTHLQAWLNQLWQQKDAAIHALVEQEDA